MPTYQVGYDDNTWEFNDAIAAAKVGDVLEIQKDYFLRFSTDVPYEITKNLTFLGLLDEENGESFFTNKFQGYIALDCGASVVFENIWFTNVKNTTIMKINENCSVTFKNCVFECTEDHNENYLFFAKDDSFVTFENCKTYFVSDESDQTIFLKNCSVTANDCFFQWRTFCEGSQLKFTNTICENYSGNAVSLKKDSRLEANNCQFYGGDMLKGYPMIWVSDSSFQLDTGIIGKVDRGQGIYSENKSGVTLTDVTVQSMDLRATITRLNNCKIMDNFDVPI